MDNNRARLEQAYEYALENNTFSKVSITEQAKMVGVYGLGKYFDDAFIKQNVQKRFGVTFLCDKNVSRLETLKKDARYSGLSMIPLSELPKGEKIVLILMLGDPRSAILELKDIVGEINCVTYNDLVLDDIMDAKKDTAFYVNEKEQALKGYDLLCDEKSKEIYVDIFCRRVAPHMAIRSYEEMCEEPQYFPEDVYKLEDGESVVDCGAYQGDTLEVFASLMGRKTYTYHAFEIDKENYNILSENVTKKEYKNIHCYNAGVWSENKTISYGRMSSSDSYSIFNQAEEEEAEVVAIDSALEKERVSLIKMDIEGAELEAVRGCKKIIVQQSPKLAICVYHRVEDLWSIPLYIKTINEKYKFYVRHHAKWWVSETVCYAVR